MIKAKGKYMYAINSIINGRHLNKICLNNAINYLHKRGYPKIPYFNLRLEYDYERHNDYDDLMGINYIVVDEFDEYGQFSRLDYATIDDNFMNALYDYFISKGYPIDGNSIDTNDRIIQFINALEADGMNIGNYFEIV